MDFYEFARGPLAMISFAVFLFGTGFRLVSFYFKGTNPKLLYPKENLTNGIRSIITGVIPFATRFMRQRPLFTIITVLFHLCALLVPLFFMAHIVLWFESYGVLWQNISNKIADVMTLFVMFACMFFFIRRLMVPEVRMVSQGSDFLILMLIFISFLTGFLAFHQMGPYRGLLIFHILSSEVLIAMIPFSRLWHMIVYPFSRYYMGADFGTVLKTRDW
ncbi:MAG: respiratory nitrate reductase subunit gamma [Proteobacteria bacterium]|nr:respiratory nitrate reductase subunit gamma [Pseudomonadota bacterium]MBU1581684.1 respiratory nitrate reductase subunit gamma [Pseudomonadota bacterium]MBU2452545.1 respiratory nitrate reductase subunit gamma [Pseudomonadota bacterium]MBU2627913.1 respiratory nitrate reductase subunit gamma [Pseudomonadota bacterium]